MDRAMRPARYFPMVVVGLAGLAGQAAMLSPCRAWDYLPAEALDESEFIDDSDAQAEISAHRPIRKSACQ